MPILAHVATESDDLSDLADVFALVYDHLDAHPPSALDVSRSISSDTAAVEIAALHCARAGGVSRRAVHDTLNLGTRREQFALLRALEGALSRIDPYVGAGGIGPLEVYRNRLENTSRLNKDTTGSVLPRRTVPGRPRSSMRQLWKDALTFLVRIADSPAPARYVRIDPEWDFSSSCRDLDAVPVAALSFVDTVSALSISRISDPGGQDWYAIAPTSTSSWDWQEHIQNALSNLDASGAWIAVLPELTLTDELLEIWASAARSAPPPPDSRLHWILAGTGPVQSTDPDHDCEQPPNRMVVIDRLSGSVVELPGGTPYTQDKNRGFSLDPGTIERWGLLAALQPPGATRCDLGEWMQEGHERLVVDTRVGRFTILICEDHGRLITEVSRIADFGPSHIFVPILSEPIRPHYWEEKGARQIAAEIGSATLVVNSSAIETPEEPGVRRYGALLVWVSNTASESEWPIYAQGSSCLQPALTPQMFHMPIA